MTNNLITFVIFFSLLFKCICAEYRTLDGTNNNLNNPLPKTLSRENPPISFYSAINVASSALIPTPGNYTSLVPTDFGICSSSNNLPDDLYPLPRCVSNLVGSMRTDANDIYNLDTLGKFKSKRKISHMTTFFGFFMVADVIAGSFGGDNYPTGIYIPRDDQLYLSNSSSNPNLAILSPALPFNRSDSTPDSAGANLNSPFVDASQIYGLTPDQLSQLRDYNENRGRMLLIKSNDTSDSALGYPPKDANGEYIFGHIAKKGRNLFTDMFYVIFLREHNRRCDQLWDIYGDSWSDETYFQECRKWVIGLLQRVTFYEYLGIVLGSPLPTYKGYNPNLDPRIDTFFSTVTYRYGHSELSDYYYIVDEKGNTLATLPLNLIQVPQVEAYGAHTLASSLALQWQEEIDIYFADTVRKFPVRYQNQEIDIASLDVVRSRDHAIPLYNDAREAMGLKRAVEWSDITSDVDAQQRLIDTYRDINRVEAYIGGLAENHVNGSEFGELFYTSFYNQWMKIRDSDRFWYESNDAGYTKEEQEEINNTTLSQIIARNIPDNYQLPPDLWIVQPPISSDDPNNKENDPLSDYPPLNQVILSDVYKIYWKIVDDEIYFQLTMASTDAWFGIGFNDKDSMITSDMLIFRNTNDNNIEARRYQADGYYTPKLISDQDDLLFKVKRIEVKSGISSLIEFSRPLSDGGHMLKTIAENKVVTMIYAWNPNSKIITYHTAGNRGSMKMDFFSNRNIDNMSVIKRKNLLFHGITMFLVWTVLYPISIWKVRYRKTKSSYAKNHRFLQMLGAVFVAISGGVALAMLGENPIRTVHGKIGISIICVISLQFILGFFNMWSLGNVESVNMGIIRLLRHIHVIFGAILLILSWVNINFGINEHSKQFGTYNWSIIALTWMGLILFIFIMSENIFRIRDMRFRYSKKPDTDRKPTQQLRYFIKDYDQLPILSLDEFNQRVVRGMKLVLVENMIFDIGKWIGVHPGGAKILQRVVGTDITHDFFGDNNNFSNDVKMKFKIDGDEFHNPEPDHKNEGENQVVITRRSNSKNEGVSESLANLIDVININKTLGKKSSRVSVHSHSKYATEKLATMIIAKLPELSDIYDEDKKFNNMGNSNQHVGYNNQPSLTSQNQHYTSQYNQPSPQIDPPDLSSPNIFRRCIITNIEVVTDNYQSNNSSIVKKFTLKTVHEDDNFPHRRFLPGDYIEIMCEIDQQRFIRQYSPLLQEFNEDYRRNDSNIETGKSNIFWILAKIYKNGPMSKYLDKQLKNFEVLVRGPFNLSDNVNLSDQPSPISDCILLNSNKPNGCWNNLFMICGGSGVTPMLQLIHYHLQYQLQRKSADTFYLYLLFANNSYSDIIYKKHLDYLVKKFKGSLSITHILVNPPDNWDGLKGHIDEVILFNWLSNNINIKPCDVNTTNVPTPKQVVYYPQQQQQFASGDDYTTPLIMPYSPSEQRQLYSTQDLLAESSSSYSSHSTIDKFPDDSKVVICGNDGFMLSIQNICNKIGIKEKDTLFLI